MFYGHNGRNHGRGLSDRRSGGNGAADRYEADGVYRLIANAQTEAGFAATEDEIEAAARRR
jgi:hypothetical protein